MLTWPAHACVQDFLESGVYKQPHMALPDGAPRQIEERFMRTMGRKLPGVPYMVTSKAPKKSTEWNRVVAVFVTGQTWQFKDWPHKACLCRLHTSSPVPVSLAFICRSRSAAQPSAARKLLSTCPFDLLLKVVPSCYHSVISPASSAPDPGVRDVCESVAEFEYCIGL